MLLLVGLAMGPQKTAIPIRLGPVQGVELVIAHDGERRAGSTHASRYMKHLTLVRSAIDEIADNQLLDDSGDERCHRHRDSPFLAAAGAARPHDPGYRHDMAVLCAHKLSSFWLRQFVKALPRVIPCEKIKFRTADNRSSPNRQYRLKWSRQ